MKIYRAFVKDEPNVPVAKSLFQYDHALDLRIVSPGFIEDWTELRFLLQGGGPTDYLANDSGMRLCSPKLFGLLNANKGTGDELQGLKVWVLDKEADLAYPYFVLRFPTQPDVLDQDRTKTTAGGRMLVKPVLAADKVIGHEVSVSKSDTMLFVSEGIKSKIDNAGCTGIDYSEALISE